MNAPLDELADHRRFATVPPPLAVRHLLFDVCEAHDLKANGLYNVARQLTAEQSAAAIDAKIVFLREEGRDLSKEPIDVPLQVIDLAGRKLRGRRIGFAGEVLNAITAGANAGAIFHIHAARQPMLIPIVLRLRRLGIPYAVTVHGRYSHVFDADNRATRLLPALYLQLVERRILEGALFVQGVSAAECEVIRRIAPSARVELVPNAAYSSRFDGVPQLPARRAPTARFPVFGFLGRYEMQHKGLDLLISGFAAFAREGGKGVLELVGTGPQRADITALARDLRIADRVTVDGPRFGQDKLDTLKGWDYFVMPSRFEGVPIGAIEAGLHGLPLIVSAGTGLRQQVADSQAGIGIDALTAAGVARAFHRAQCARDAWCAMSSAAHQMALSIGDWTSIAARLVSLYGQRAAAPGTSRQVGR